MPKFQEYIYLLKIFVIIQLVNLLHSAHQVDGIVKGLKIPEWPTDGWQALHRLALGLCQACAAPSASAQIIPSRHRVSP
jgi:DNA polymerase-3 subunit delta